MLMLLRRRDGVRYLLRATFSQDMAAPLPASLPVDVGGPLTTVQVDGQFSQSGGKLVFPAQATPAWGDQGMYGTAFSRVAGRAVFGSLMRSSGSYSRLGWHTTNSGLITIAFETQTTALQWLSGGASGSTGATVATNTEYQYAIVQRSAGYFYLIKGGAFTNWTLLWVTEVGTTATLYPSFINYDNVGTLDNLRVLDLAIFATDAQVYTSRLASPSAGATTTSTADAVIEFTFVWSNAANTRIQIRRTDVNNNWMIDAAAGGNFSLWERNAGATTQRANTTPGFVNGQTYRVVVVAEGSTIKTYLSNVLQHTYSSAANNQTATTAFIEAAGGGVSEVIAWPRSVSLPGGV